MSVAISSPVAATPQKTPIKPTKKPHKTMKKQNLIPAIAKCPLGTKPPTAESYCSKEVEL